MAMATRAKPVRTWKAETSARQKRAKKVNEGKAIDCKHRFHDCETACRQYPKGSEGKDECNDFCSRSKAACMEWTNH